ncbi:FliM/FliN family flagellar motor switch protein, partial [Burkholderia pseudomallei]
MTELNSTPEADGIDEPAFADTAMSAAAAGNAAGAAPQEEMAMDDWAAALAEQNQQPIETGATGAGVFRPLSKATASSTHNDIDLILDIPVKMTVELGRTKIAIRNLLQLAQGSVVE